jgi:hypothetical protein
MRKHPMSHILIDCPLAPVHHFQHPDHNTLRESYMDKTLSWFIKGWIVLALLVNVAAVIGFFLSAATLRDGRTRVADTYGPGNVANLFAELLFLSPAFGAMYWRDKRRTRLLKSAAPSQPKGG